MCEPENSTKVQNQSCLYLYDVFGRHHWESLIEELATWVSVNQTMIGIFTDLGISNASATTKKVAMCIMYMCHELRGESSQTLTVSPGDFYYKKAQFIEDLLNHFKNRQDSHLGQVP